MALADYRFCDNCGSKAFYDANLNYDIPTRDHTVPTDEQIRDSGYKLDYLGDWAVLCRDCAKTHKCVIVSLETPNVMTSEQRDAAPSP